MNTVKIIFITPLPIIGLITWLFNNTLNESLFYLLLPLIIITIMFTYLIMITALLIISYKTGPELKEGEYDINSRMANSWVKTNLILRVLWLIQPLTWWLPSMIYRKVFNSIVMKPVINGGFVEHSLVDMGSNCIIGSHAEVLGHSFEGGKLIIKRVRIGSNVTIGAKSIVMPGAIIGDNVIIGALSFVPKNAVLKPNRVYAGTPVKIVRKL